MELCKKTCRISFLIIWSSKIIYHNSIKYYIGLPLFCIVYMSMAANYAMNIDCSQNYKCSWISILEAQFGNMYYHHAYRVAQKYPTFMKPLTFCCHTYR